jgi:hypothetical protein
MVKSASRVSRVVMTGPLASCADSYALELEQRRHTPLTSVAQLRQVERLSSWLEVRGLGVAELTGERVEEFLAFQRASWRWRWVVTSRPAVPAGCAAAAGGSRRRGTSAGWLAEGCVAGVVRALPAHRARLGGWYCSWLRASRSPVPGWVVAPRPCRRDGGRRDGGRAARVHGGLGERDTILRRRVAGVAALLRCRGVDARRPVPAGAAGDRPARCCLGGSLPPRPGPCSTVAIDARRSGGATSR